MPAFLKRLRDSDYLLAGWNKGSRCSTNFLLLVSYCPVNDLLRTRPFRFTAVKISRVWKRRVPTPENQNKIKLKPIPGDVEKMVKVFRTWGNSPSSNGSV